MKFEVATIAPTRKVGAMLFLLFCMFSAKAQYTPSATAWKKVEHTLTKMYGVAVEKTAVVDNAPFYALHRADSLLAYLCVEQASSKHDVFEYMVLYDPAINIQKVQVLVYREDYGFEIKNKRWLKQFSNRPVDKVQAISGATISVSSLKHSIEDLNKRLAAWKETQSE